MTSVIKLPFNNWKIQTGVCGKTVSSIVFTLSGIKYIITFHKVVCKQKLKKNNNQKCLQVGNTTMLQIDWTVRAALLICDKESKQASWQQRMWFI